MNFRIAISLILVTLLTSAVWADESSSQAKEALKTFNEYVGQWKGNGESKTTKADWKESAEWSWNLKSTTPALKMKLAGAKQFSEATLTFLPDTKKFQLTVKENGKDAVYVGEIKSKRLVVTREDAKTKDKYTIEMSTNNEGARFVYNVAQQKGGVGIARKLVEVSYSKEGASLAGGKKNECIVTGGLGTMAVSFEGKTYYVCCSGCRDEFNATPKKYIEEFEKAKKK